MGDSDLDEMLKTLNRIKSNIDICNSNGLKNEFKRLDREFDTFVFDRKISKHVLTIYLEGLGIVERLVNDVLSDNYKKKAPDMTVREFSTKDVLTLCSLQNKVIKRYNKYRDLVTSQFGDINVYLDLSDECFYNVDKKVLSEGQERLERLTQAAALATVSQTPDQKLSSAMHLCASPRTLSIKRLTKIVQNLLIVLHILTKYPNIVLTNEHSSFSIRKCETTKGTWCKGRIRVRGDLLSLVMQICCKFTKFLKSAKPDDVEKLKGEAIMLVALQNVMDYFRNTYNFSEAAKGCMDYFQKERNFSEAAMDFEDDSIRKDNLSKAATVALSLIRRVYDKSQDLYETMLKVVDQIEFPASIVNKDDEEHSLPSTSQIVCRRPGFPEKCEMLMTELVNFAASHGNEDIKSHALLYQVYHLAVMDDFSKACDLLRGYMQNGVQKMNSQTQLHFNRAVAQIGLCAYRAGLVEEAHGFLSDLLCAHGRVEELLLQGAIGGKVPPGAAMVIRVFPYHKPIDLEHLKAVHIKCCILLEDPHIVNTTTRPNEVHFVSSRIRTPIGSEGRSICGASWERVCDGKFCCALNNKNNNNNNNNDTGGDDLFRKWIKSRGLQLL